MSKALDQKTEYIDVTVRTSAAKGKFYFSVMFSRKLVSSGRGLREGKVTKEEEMIQLELLKILVRQPLPFGAVRDPSGAVRTLVKQEGPSGSAHYRIDNQIDVSHGAIVAYQIGGESVASVEVKKYPISVPTGDEQLTKLTIDDDKFGFRKEQVWGCMENALRYSLKNRCKTCVEWFIAVLTKDKRAKFFYPDMQRSADSPNKVGEALKKAVLKTSLISEKKANAMIYGSHQGQGAMELDTFTENVGGKETTEIELKSAVDSLAEIDEIDDIGFLRCLVAAECDECAGLEFCRGAAYNDPDPVKASFSAWLETNDFVLIY